MSISKLELNPFYKGPKVIQSFLMKSKSSGSLTKVFSKFHKKFFTLDLVHVFLYYGAKPETKIKNSKIIDLDELVHVKRNTSTDDRNKKMQWSFMIVCKSRVYTLVCQNEDIYNLWIYALMNLRNRFSKEGIFADGGVPKLIDGPGPVEEIKRQSTQKAPNQAETSVSKGNSSEGPAGNITQSQVARNPPHRANESTVKLSESQVKREVSNPLKQQQPVSNVPAPTIAQPKRPQPETQPVRNQSNPEPQGQPQVSLKGQPQLSDAKSKGSSTSLSVQPQQPIKQQPLQNESKQLPLNSNASSQVVAVSSPKKQKTPEKESQTKNKQANPKPAFQPSLIPNLHSSNSSASKAKIIQEFDTDELEREYDEKIRREKEEEAKRLEEIEAARVKRLKEIEAERQKEALAARLALENKKKLQENPQGTSKRLDEETKFEMVMPENEMEASFNWDDDSSGDSDEEPVPKKVEETVQEQKKPEKEEEKNDYEGNWDDWDES